MRTTLLALAAALAAAADTSPRRGPLDVARLRKVAELSDAADFAFSPDGRFAALARRDAQIVRITCVTWRRDDAVGVACTELAWGLAWHPDGRFVACGVGDGIRLIDPQSWTQTAESPSLPARGRAMAMSPDGTRIAVAAADVRVLDVATLTWSADLAGHADKVFGLAWSPDGRRLASASFDGTVRVIDVARRAARTLVSIPDARLFAVSFSPDGARLAVSVYEGDAMVVDAVTGRPLTTLKGDGRTITSLTWLAGGTRILAGGPCETLAWDVATNSVGATPLVHGARTYTAALSPSARAIAFLTGRATVEVWAH